MSSNAQIHEETWKLMTKLTVIGGDDQHIEEYIIVFKTDHPEVVLPKRCRIKNPFSNPFYICYQEG